MPASSDGPLSADAVGARDTTKVDPRLAVMTVEPGRDDGPVAVFVELRRRPTALERRQLATIGLVVPTRGRMAGHILTAVVAANQVAAIAAIDSVVYVRGASTLSVRSPDAATGSPTEASPIGPTRRPAVSPTPTS